MRARRVSIHRSGKNTCSDLVIHSIHLISLWAIHLRPVHRFFLFVLVFVLVFVLLVVFVLHALHSVMVRRETWHVECEMVTVWCCIVRDPGRKSCTPDSGRCARSIWKVSGTTCESTHASHRSSLFDKPTAAGIDIVTKWYVYGSLSLRPIYSALVLLPSAVDDVFFSRWQSVVFADSESGCVALCSCQPERDCLSLMWASLTSSSLEHR